MWFTSENTQGYTDAELDALNDEMDEIMSMIDPDDIDAQNEAEKAFKDKVAAR